MTQFSSLYGSYLDEELGNDDGVLFTTARRKAATNKGAAKFASLTQCLERRISFTWTGGTPEYDLNSTLTIPSGDFSDFSADGLEVAYTDASSRVTILARDTLLRRDIDWLNQNEPGWRQSTIASSLMQLPRYYYMRADGPSLLIGLTPVLSTGSSASAVANLSYIANAPVMVNDTDQPFTFNGSPRMDLASYHQGIAHYAAHQLEKLRQDDARSDRQLQKFLGFVAQYFQDRRIKGGRQIRQGRDYFKRRTGAWGAFRVWTGK